MVLKDQEASRAKRVLRDAKRKINEFKKNMYEELSTAMKSLIELKNKELKFLKENNPDKQDKITDLEKELDSLNQDITNSEQESLKLDKKLDSLKEEK